VPKGGSGTLGTTGDLKKMDPRWVVGVSFQGYGASLQLGIGIPIPILDEDVARFTGVSDADLTAPIIDYSHDYPELEGGPLGHVSYADLRSGTIEFRGKKIPTAGLSSYPKAREIAEILKEQVQTGQFEISKPVELLPSAESGKTFKMLRERPALAEEVS
jgi:uncharacterized protein (DUF39 family)